MSETEDERDAPSALVPAVPALDLLVDALGDVLLEDLGALALVDACDLEDLRRVEPAVDSPPHDADPADHHLVHGHRRVDGEAASGWSRRVSRMKEVDVKEG